MSHRKKFRNHDFHDKLFKKLHYVFLFLKSIVSNN